MRPDVYCILSTGTLLLAISTPENDDLHVLPETQVLEIPQNLMIFSLDPCHSDLDVLFMRGGGEDDGEGSLGAREGVEEDVRIV